MDEIRPHNTNERLFNIVVFLIAFVMAAVFISHLTSSMTQLNMMSSRQMLQLAALRRFLLENQVSDLLAVRIQRSAQNTLSQQLKHTPEAKVDMLAFVSGPLLVELHFELYAPIFVPHAFFSRYIVECPQVMKKVCHEAVSLSNYGIGDLIFHAGEKPASPVMYFMWSGEMDYESTTVLCVVSVGQWLSEQALWTEWRHRGTLIARTQCRMATLASKKFQEITCTFNHRNFDPKDYARRYVKKMNELKDEMSDLPVTDVSLPGDKQRARKQSLLGVMPFLATNARAQERMAQRVFAADADTDRT